LFEIFLARREERPRGGGGGGRERSARSKRGGEFKKVLLHVTTVGIKAAGRAKRRWEEGKRKKRQPQKSCIDTALFIVKRGKQIGAAIKKPDWNGGSSARRTARRVRAVPRGEKNEVGRAKSLETFTKPGWNHAEKNAGARKGAHGFFRCWGG